MPEVTAKITNPADQKQADGLLGTESKLLGAIPIIGAIVGVAMGAALGGFVGAAVSTSLLASAAVPVRSTGTSQAGGGGAKGGLHPLKYLAGLFMQGLISQYEHEKAKDAYYSKWLLGKVFTSARHIASSGGLQELVQNMVIESNAIAHAYQQVPPEVRKRWMANSNRYTAEQPKPKQEESRSWLAMLGEAQIRQAEAQLAMGKKIAEVGVQTGEEIWSGVKKTGNSFAEIGIDFWNGLEVRANKSLDSPYDFGNWLTVGAFDEVSSRIEGYKTRADMRNDSPYDYVNWLSSGIAGSLNGAFNPDDPLSKEHWMNSFGVFTSVAGARGVVPKGGGPTLPKVNAKTPVPKVQERANLDVNKRKNDTTETGNFQTGGKSDIFDPDEYLRNLDKADKMYESFRQSTTDVASIAKNTGMKESRVQRIKDHLYNNEHIKDHGVGRFDADYEIAQAWERLQAGTHRQSDIDLINHELFESRFEGIFKTNYRTAHDKTIESGRPWNP